ncbi:hypothetical protein C4D60_Mb06t27130 [Musa balbisiana]|uniref:MHD1 domain-containing protein n=1 Tax=Musa balbisiana TaxID=52838 RepID=A0A4S8IQZ2_MUSBA|nr:hypothetical protein C4D60_Mb06t27130 [Musa balbisiana]
MARLLGGGSLGDSKRESNGTSSLRISSSTAAADLPSPFGQLGVALSDPELRETAYEIFVAACRTTGAKSLAYVPQAERSPSLSPSSASSLQRSLTSAAASKMKKTLGIRPSSKKGSPGKEGSPSKSAKKPATVGELMRVQMRVSEQTDSRIRKGLVRIAAGQLGRRVESMVLPLELLQQFKTSDFPDQQEYEAWKTRNLNVLEAGLLVHPLLPLEKSDTGSQRLRQIIRGASGKPIETGRNSESMQVLRSAVMSIACRSPDGSSDFCHWADGFPLNLHLYQMLLEACFDDSEDGSIIDEIDEVLELIKKTWVILGINQILHNLCFAWVLFHCFVTTGEADIDLLFAADNQMAEVAKDAKATKDPDYSKILSSTLSSILGWTEKRLLAYHDTFSASNIEFFQGIISLGVSAAKILVEDISNEYRRKKREESDVARSRVDTYIRSSLRTAFAQRMEQADSRRSSKNHNTPTPVLSILANDIGELARKEKELFSPILKKWHPLAAGAAVATLHSCYGSELRQFISSATEVTPDTVEVLKAADKLEKALVHIAVEDSVDSEDGGKSLIREMPPYEADIAIANLVKVWIKTREERLKDWVDRNLQQENWNPRANMENCAPSATEVLRIINETLDAFFQLPIQMHAMLLPDLLIELDKSLQRYTLKVKSGCELENLEKKIKTCLRNLESAQADIANGLQISFEMTVAACHEGILQLCETTAYKVIFHDLSHVLWDALYIGGTASSRIDPFIKEADHILETISNTVHSRVRNRIVTAMMKASFDGFLLVLLAGGPSRAFSRQDSEIIEVDFRSLKDMYLADGDGLPQELVEKAASQVKNVLPLFHTDTENLIERFKRLITETYGAASKSRYPLPPTSGNWNPTEANTVLRVLCHRHDEAATSMT